MRLGGLLESQNGFASVTAVRVTAGQQTGLRDPHAVLIAARLNFGDWNDHGAKTIAGLSEMVNGLPSFTPLTPTLTPRPHALKQGG